MLHRTILRSRILCKAAKVTFGSQCSGSRNAARLATHLVCRSFSDDKRGTTIGDVIKRWSERFEHEGIPEPVESIEHIVAHIIGTRKLMDVENSLSKHLDAAQIANVEKLCECRLLRMPVQYIIGEWDFRDITLKLVPPVFIPRPETEILVDFVLKRVHASQLDNCEVFEIGCGSGAISLALAHACDKVKCIAIDSNAYACELTKENRSSLGLNDRVVVINATLSDDGTIELPKTATDASSVDFSTKQFDIIVSNPPYVPTKCIPKLEPEIKIYEDLRALDGGHDGLKVIKPLMHYASKALKPGGRLLMEVDTNHPEYISFFTKKYAELKLRYEHSYKDFCNKDRFVEVLKLP